MSGTMLLVFTANALRTNKNVTGRFEVCPSLLHKNVKKGSWVKGTRRSDEGYLGPGLVDLPYVELLVLFNSFLNLVRAEPA